MSMVNVTLVGNLARSPEQICFASGRVKTVLVIAVNGSAAKSAASSRNGDKGSQNCASFYRVETWGKLAELAHQYLSKGNQVGVSGRLIMEHWTDKQGHERLTPVVAATQLSFPPRPAAARAVENNKGGNTDAESEESYDDDLFSGARAVSVAEPPAHYHSKRQRSRSFRH